MNGKLKFIVLTAVFALCFSCIAKAATYYVDCDVPVSGNGSSWEQSFKTITAGKNVATQSGDIVEISGGTYNESI